MAAVEQPSDVVTHVGIVVGDQDSAAACAPSGKAAIIAQLRHVLLSRALLAIGAWKPAQRLADKGLRARSRRRQRASAADAVGCEMRNAETGSKP